MERILFVQHGNYAEAYESLGRGGQETYRDQRRSVEFVARLAEDRTVTTVAICNTPHDIRLQPSLRSIGMTRDQLSAAHLRAMFRELAPDATILRTPRLGLLQAALRQGGWILPCYADIFRAGGVRNRLTNIRLRRALSDRRIRVYANHSMNASQSMASALGLPKDRIVPWDWSRFRADENSKTGPGDPASLSVFYAGALTVDKGVDDCLQAIPECRRLGFQVRFTFAGSGDAEAWQRRADQLGTNGAVFFLGLVPNSEVRRQMRAHDVVVVPSRPNYPEGLPNTLYEGLASRSALVISNHPAFQGRLEDGRQCLVFEAANPVSLARALQRLISEPALYATLSAHSAQALESLFVGIEWETLIGQFLEDPEDRTGWVARNCLQALGY